MPGSAWHLTSCRKGHGEGEGSAWVRSLTNPDPGSAHSLRFAHTVSSHASLCHCCCCATSQLDKPGSALAWSVLKEEMQGQHALAVKHFVGCASCRWLPARGGTVTKAPGNPRATPEKPQWQLAATIKPT